MGTIGDYYSLGNIYFMLKVILNKPKKVVIVIPGGTNPQIETLLNHLTHEVNYFDECHLWLNTFHKGNIDYMLRTAKNYKFVQCVHRDFKMADAIHGIGLFMNKCKYDHLYIRLDNDICYIEPGAIKRLVKYRLENPNLFMAFGNVINNPFTYHFYQKEKVIYHNSLPLSYHNEGRDSCNLMLLMHKKFLGNYKKPKLFYIKPYTYKSSELTIPINVISWFGNALKAFGSITGNEEAFLNSRSSINGVCGNALFSHLSYATQRTNCHRQHRIKEYQEIERRYLELSRLSKLPS